MSNDLQAAIDAAWEGRDAINAQTTGDTRDAIDFRAKTTFIAADTAFANNSCGAEAFSYEPFPGCTC